MGSFSRGGLWDGLADRRYCPGDPPFFSVCSSYWSGTGPMSLLSALSHGLNIPPQKRADSPPAVCSFSFVSGQPGQKPLAALQYILPGLFKVPGVTGVGHIPGAAGVIQQKGNLVVRVIPGEP